MENLIVQTLINGLMLAMVLILLASGLCLIFGILHVVNFAHGEFYMLGGFSVWLLYISHPLPFLTELNALRYIVAMILTMITVGVIGVFVERYVYKPFRGDIKSTVIAATGIMFILQASMLVAFGIRDKAFGSPFAGMIKFGGVSFSQERFIVIIFGIIFFGAMYLFIKKTKIGLAMRAVAQDMDIASIHGINIDRTYSIAMCIGCALAAAGGALIAPIYYVNPYMGIGPIMKAFAVIILGGLGSLSGAVIGGLIVGIVESFASTFLGSHLALMIVFLLLITILLVKPTGLFGHDN